MVESPKVFDIPHADPWVEPLQPEPAPRRVYVRPPMSRWEVVGEWLGGSAPFAFVAFMTLLAVAKDMS